MNLELLKKESEARIGEISNLERGGLVTRH
jgi:hypothetical protein